MNPTTISHFVRQISNNSIKFFNHNDVVRRCFCSSSSRSTKSTGQNSENQNEPLVKTLLDDAALGFGPMDEIDGDDEWISSPYPQGAIVNPKQSQAMKSLRPKVNPGDTSIILFPGQGSQYVGMGADLLKFPAARDIFDAASEILKYDILKLMLNGPESKLNETMYCQPAVVVCSLAAIEKLKEERPSALESCIATAGFSVGEITALTFAGVFSFGDAIKLVRARAEAMQLASEMAPGGMATVMYRHDTKLNEALKKAKEWCLDKGIEHPECSIANYLNPDMKVVAGHLEAVEFLERNYREFRIKKIKRIPVSGAFHTDLMKPAVEPFQVALKNVEMSEPYCFIYSNVDGKRYRSPDDIRKKLPEQIYRPMQWEQMIQRMYKRSKDIEIPKTFTCGPGTSLKTMLRDINNRAACACEPITA
ncbi:probable malonyl-CoA-acyl carrier protein transacylase, mitochondrial isoform X2 [Planococcus citri]|uniref:probable malonyl-CoA-acyl carrier protein transacylase, mitochondrial isoform X2 n=1 Tax=Planococcus citri TaxID=170843 RepID=UPI0031FA2D81